MIIALCRTEGSVSVALSRPITKEPYSQKERVIGCPVFLQRRSMPVADRAETGIANTVGTRLSHIRAQRPRGTDMSRRFQTPIRKLSGTPGCLDLHGTHGRSQEQPAHRELASIELDAERKRQDQPL